MRALWAMAIHAVLLAVFYWWLGIGDDAAWKLGMTVFVAIVWIAALVLFERWLFRGRALDFRRLGAFALACLLAWALLRWAPNVAGAGPQLLSFFLRLGLAWAALNWTWVQIGRQSGAPKPHDGLAAVPGD
jgi:hypothetical protein